MNQMVQSFDLIYSDLTEEEQNSFSERVKIYGEIPAMHWVIQQHPPNSSQNVDQTVAFTASTTDTNQPAPTLTLTLLSSPANATLIQTDNNDANFSWQPRVTNANTTNWISLKVAHNGTPS
ncbi:MAG: hypothetical protein ACLP7I_18095 [Limisphaerales bacterium]